MDASGLFKAIDLPFYAERLAVGVSGGPDSMALALMLAEALGHEKIVALTVDHGLRPESAEEAQQVAQWMATHGIEHHILEAEIPSQNVQAVAREARYRLLETWCRNNGILYLALAHHQDDQAETLLLRLSRGSGLVGLSAMSPMRALRDVLLLRPLLNTSKAELKAWLEARNQPWIEDPSNDNPNYARVALRRIMPDLRPLGLDAASLAATAARLQVHRHQLEVSLARFLAAHAQIRPEGYIRLQKTAWLEAEEEIALRALGQCLKAIGGGDYPPRWDELRRLRKALIYGRAKGHTLGGCYLFIHKAQLMITREVVAAEHAPLTPPQHWDNRFWIEGPCTPNLTIAPLGEEGWAQACQSAKRPHNRGLDVRKLYGLPALWKNAHLMAIPHLNFQCEKTLKMPHISLRLKNALAPPHIIPITTAA